MILGMVGVRKGGILLSGQLSDHGFEVGEMGQQTYVDMLIDLLSNDQGVSFQFQNPHLQPQIQVVTTISTSPARDRREEKDSPEQ